ncbi:unnamed protein product [Musa acuminata subsp. malaccensis]|uniref:(wild Malaysian banana) hypothetical protein n=1 Tax=Musa acuminata subsp. malaccensis TaxID=214687 RepID=A0A804JWY8_MUSAM|nr:PREDICTED: uncharacterized protein LOC103974432 isoform X1 [Musa acuminata subsp. malaccensis]CAG1856854.1 unnamed protein product [Musa acuminata subsp. malaccensis]
MGGGKRRFGRNGGRGHPRGSGSAVLFSDHAGISEMPRGRGYGAKKDGNRPMPARGNAFGYAYPAADIAGGRDDTSCPISLPCSENSQPLEVFVDPTPCLNPEVGIPSYEYDLSMGGVRLGFHGGEEEEEQEAAPDAVSLDTEFIGGVGLGFRRDAEEEEEEDERGYEEEEELLGFDSFCTPEVTREEKGRGFLSIGGIRVYTEDTSSPEEEMDLYEEDDTDDEDGDLLIENEIIGSAGESSQEDDEENEEDYSSEGDSFSSDDGSDVNDEVAQDYLDGIGGGVELLRADWMEAVNLDSSDEDDLLKSRNSVHKGGTKLGGIALMNASAEYGMKKPKSRKLKGNARYNMTGSPALDVGLLPMDDLLVMKDNRAALRKKKSSHLLQSWPREAQRNKYSNAPGGKKKQRKELIALKRRQRMINRGVDLDQIHYKLRQMVVNEVDMLSFQPMHTRDCSQVQRLASIYHLRSGCQGSGKKRFVTVSRTERTCLLSTRDKLRLDKLLGVSVNDVDDFIVNQGTKIKCLKQPKGRKNLGKGPASHEHQSAPSKLLKSSEASGSRKRIGKQRLASYAARPVSFVSTGVMEVDPAKETITVDSSASTSLETVATSHASIGAFEVHTKGFGSRLMAKMGFVEGTGLGKAGQGMVQPIQVVKRPKSLGLGVQFEDETSSAGAEIGRIGAFERHTKGFGSKMMVKMGFVPGTGLGKDSQGIINPLTAVKQPKSRGLGAKT